MMVMFIFIITQLLVAVKPMPIDPMSMPIWPKTEE